MRSKGASDGAWRRPPVYIQVLSAPTSSEKSGDRIRRGLRPLEQVNVESHALDPATLAILRSKTISAADMWIALSDKPLDDDATEVLVIPFLSRNDELQWLPALLGGLESSNVHDAESGYAYLRGRDQEVGTASVLFRGVPWRRSVAASSPPLVGGGQRSGAGSGERERAAEAALTEYNDLMQSLAEEGRNLPAGARDAILDHFRRRIAEHLDCTNDVIPSPLNELIDDDEIRRFVWSALCVQRLAAKHPDAFDFALPGSGLWKAFERALNLSIVAALRREAGIVTSNPFIADGVNATQGQSKVALTGERMDTTTKKLKPKYQPLGGTRRGKALQGIMLGDVMAILQHAREKLPTDAEREFVPVDRVLEGCLERTSTDASWSVFLFGSTGAKICDSPLTQAIGMVSSLRNPHAHTRAMNDAKYFKLRRIVLDDGQLGKLLQLVRLIGVPGPALTGASDPIEQGN